VSKAFRLLWVFILFLPIWYFRPTYIILTTKPIWVRGNSRIRLRFWINFSMVYTKFRRTFFGSSPVSSFTTSWCIPRTSTASPTFRPETHPRSKLVYSRMMLTTVFLVFASFIFHTTSPSCAYHLCII